MTTQSCPALFDVEALALAITIELNFTKSNLDGVKIS
jgi:hypothetical protein